MNFDNKEMIKGALNGASVVVYGSELSDVAIDQFFGEIESLGIENPHKIVEAIAKVKSQRMKSENFKKIVIAEVLNVLKPKIEVKKEYNGCLNCDGYGFVTALNPKEYEYVFACSRCDHGKRTTHCRSELAMPNSYVRKHELVEV